MKNMKKETLLVLKKTALFSLIVLLLTSCTNSNKYSISGKITGAEGKILRLSKLNLDGVEVLDSVKLDNEGDYHFKGDKLKEPTFFTLNLGKKNITFLNDSNIAMKISGNLASIEENYQITNSPESAYIKQLNNNLRNTISEIDELQNKYIKATSPVEKGAITSQISSQIEKHKEFIGEFISNHPRSFASYYAIYQKFDNETFVLNVYDKRDQIFYATIATSLNVYYPNNERVKNLYEFVLNAKKRENNAKVADYLNTLPSIPFPELKIADVKGREVALSSLKGKVILLSFWASWSKESRAFNRELKRVYKKFGSKNFEIYQVSLDQNRLYWEAAIAQDELPWTNVCEFTFPNAYSATIYNVSRLPANYLIGKSGEIVGKDLEGSLLDDKITSNL